ncbi:MAG: class I SAM-dependent methyltransferase [Candidatus Sumerlaeia bacterium]|nr:class I SAM-dependent methyltransferase [Candidatus Sumerlaeia bacterium]
MTHPADPTERFSGRAGEYVRYRPTYPAGMAAALRALCDLRPDHIVADIGCGTGLLAEVFLDNGNQVLGVEPNGDMRAAGAERLRGRSAFRALAGSAEATGLRDSSVDFVTAGQAFHWFDASACRREFARILRPGGWVVLVWNDRRGSGDPFHEGLERLIEAAGSDYSAVKSRMPDAAALRRFYGSTPRIWTAENVQEFDLAGLCGRIASCSYVPETGTPEFATLREGIVELFTRHARNGRVRLAHDTRLYAGQLGEPA